MSLNVFSPCSCIARLTTAFLASSHDHTAYILLYIISYSPISSPHSRPTPLLETLWALSEYADGYTLGNGVVTNAYDLDPSLQPPRRGLAGFESNLPPMKSASALLASIYRGVAMSLYPYVDAFLCESLPDIRTAEAVSFAAMTTDKPVFVSFQLSK